MAVSVLGCPRVDFMDYGRIFSGSCMSDHAGRHSTCTIGPVRIVGTPMSMRAVGGAVRNSRVFSRVRVRSLCAQCGCVNHRIFNGRPSLRVPPGSFAAKYHVYMYYYTANRRLCMGVPPYRSVSYQNCVGPPK